MTMLTIQNAYWEVFLPAVRPLTILHVDGVLRNLTTHVIITHTGLTHAAITPLDVTKCNMQVGMHLSPYPLMVFGMISHG